MKIARLALIPLLASFFALGALGASSAADPDPPTPPPPPANGPTTHGRCTTTGTPAFEVDHDAVAGAKLTTAKTRMWEDGGWTFVETLGDGKPGRSFSGCIIKTDLDKLKAVLDAAWTINHPRIHCMAMAQTYTTYHAKGKTDFVARTCGNDIVDDKTSAALTDLEKQLSDVVDAQTAMQHNPPCCKH
jgi:hypothetical protein